LIVGFNSKIAQNDAELNVLKLLDYVNFLTPVKLKIKNSIRKAINNSVNFLAIDAFKNNFCASI
jgi:hypothetical protein